jgi:predicted O-linked N-acetylglucosamine transferase (SPINDLY family)
VQAQCDHLLEAADSLGRALDLEPDNFRIRTNLANVLASMGLFEQACSHFERATASNAHDSGSFHGLTFCANYHPDKPAEQIYAAYEAYEQQFGAPLRAQWQPHGHAPLTLPDGTARRLRIGYVSPDFRQHSVRHFLEPLLAHHDHARFEVFAYAELAREDAATQRYRSYCDHFVLTRGMSDEALAERIRADAIDVLIDVAGHTAGNRLLVFARKPAPVSLSWLGYGYTTGLKAIDYLLTDEASAPAGSEHLFSETPWRLAGTSYVFRPDPTMGQVSPLPALANGFVTFGTLTRAIRINHRTVRVWAQILKRVPGSRLVIDSKNFQHASMQQAMAERFAEHGIERDRLRIGCHSPPWDTLRAIDIGLDCFPHNSGTTLFETLYMGVPYVTLAGRPSVGRLGKSILTGLGNPQWAQAWCATSEEAYIDQAVALASDLAALQRTRSALRPHMESSSLMDEAGFTQRMEQACAQMHEQRLQHTGAAT